MLSIVQALLLALYTAGSGFIVWQLLVVSVPLWEMPYGQSVVALLVLWVIDPRWLLLAFAWIAPLVLYYHDNKSGYLSMEVIAALVLLRDGAERLWHLARRRDTGTSAVPLPAWPGAVSLSLLALALVSVAASLQVAPNIFYDIRIWPQDPALGYVSHYSLVAMFGWSPSMLAHQIPIQLILAIGLMDFAYRRCDASFARQFILIGSFGCIISSGLGILEYFGMLDLRGYRPRHEEITYIFNTRRLMSLAQHSAWFAEYVVLTWPFLLFFEPRMRGRRARRFFHAMVALIAGAAVLTLQRAFWLILLVLLGMIAVRAWLHRRHRLGILLRTHGLRIVTTLAVSVVVLSVIDYFTNHVIARRLVTLFAYRDRLYYYYSTMFILGESPAGVGTGMHAQIYESFFVRWADFFQGDHDTAHNLWLHLAAERGLLAPLAMLVFPAALLGVAWHARLLLPDDERRPAFCLTLSLTGIFMYGAFQYIFYLRAIQIYVFIAAGLLLRIAWPRVWASWQSTESAHRSSRFGALLHPSPRWRVAIVLLIAGGVALTALGQREFYERVVPELSPSDEADSATWSGERIRFALPCSAETFSAIAYAFDASKTVRVELDPPNPQAMTIELPKGEAREVHLDLIPYDAPVWRKYRWLTLEASSTVAEAKLNPNGGDRTLGIYLQHIVTENNPFAAPAAESPSDETAN